MTAIDYSNVKRAQAGESYTWYFDVSNVAATDLLTKAYLMLKTDIGVADGSATISKTVTTSNVVGTGQVVKPAGGVQAVRFDFLAADTAALSAREYVMAMKAITVGGVTAYIETGIFRLAPALITST